jgi:hypothetical protein
MYLPRPQCRRLQRSRSTCSHGQDSPCWILMWQAFGMSTPLPALRPLPYIDMACFEHLFSISIRRAGLDYRRHFCIVTLQRFSRSNCFLFREFCTTLRRPLVSAMTDFQYIPWIRNILGILTLLFFFLSLFLSSILHIYLSFFRYQSRRKKTKEMKETHF